MARVFPIEAEVGSIGRDHSTVGEVFDAAHVVVELIAVTLFSNIVGQYTRPMSLLHLMLITMVGS